MQYSIITPVKNESKYIGETIESVINQTKLPQEWLIVDDSSTDNTKKIVQEYLEDYTFIKLISAPRIKISEISARIASLLNFAYKKLSVEVDLIMKLDGDVTLPKDYCENFSIMFLKDKKLGIASGCADYKGARDKNEDKSLTRGAAKFYKKECFEEIGYAYLSRGWDTIDNYAAQCLGWETKKIDIFFEHNKEEGKKSGLIMLRYWTGLFNGRVPYYFPYFALKIVYYLFSRPIIIGSLLEFIGYLNSRFITKTRPFPKEVSEYVIKRQKEKILSYFKREN